jgi:hypothetical protein
MATDFAKPPVPSKGSLREGAEASALGRLVRLLALQAAREVIASGLSRAAHKAASEISLTDAGSSAEKWDGSDEG